MTTWWYCLSVMILIECNDIDWAWWLTWLIDNCTVKTTEWTVLTQRFLDVGVCPKHLHSLQACSPVNYDAFEKHCCLCSSWYQWMLKAEHIRMWWKCVECSCIFTARLLMLMLITGMEFIKHWAYHLMRIAMEGAVCLCLSMRLFHGFDDLWMDLVANLLCLRLSILPTLPACGLFWISKCNRS